MEDTSLTSIGRAQSEKGAKRLHDAIKTGEILPPFAAVLSPSLCVTQTVKPTLGFLKCPIITATVAREGPGHGAPSIKGVNLTHSRVLRGEFSDSQDSNWEGYHNDKLARDGAQGASMIMAKALVETLNKLSEGYHIRTGREC
jgi:hypothetical protein